MWYTLGLGVSVRTRDDFAASMVQVIFFHWQTFKNKKLAQSVQFKLGRESIKLGNFSNFYHFQQFTNGKT